MLQRVLPVFDMSFQVRSLWSCVDMYLVIWQTGKKKEREKFASSELLINFAADIF